MDQQSSMFTMDCKHSVFEQLPQLTEKMVVDLVNGLEVAGEHCRVQKQRLDSLSRVKDALTGAGALRQQQINQNVISGLETSLHWLRALDASQARSMRAISSLTKGVDTLAQQLGNTRDGVVHVHRELLELTGKVQLRFQELEEGLRHVDAQQKASRHLEQVFAAWGAGRLAQYPPMTRLFLALDQLYWGDFGNYCHANHAHHETLPFLEHAKNKAITQLRQDLSETPSTMIDISHWFSPPEKLTALQEDAVAYLASEHAEIQPLGQFIAAGGRPEQMGNRVPRILSINRAADRMCEEVFQRRVA